MKKIDEASKKHLGMVAETASEFRDLVLLTTAEILAGRIKPELAKQVFNGAGKAAKLASLQVEAAAIGKTKLKCKFIEDAE
jgi:hypothetical protein